MFFTIVLGPEMKKTRQPIGTTTFGDNGRLNGQ